MKLEIRLQDIDDDGALRRYAERRVRFALGRVAPRVRRVTLRLRDENGPRGGVDIRCVVMVWLDGHEPLVADALCETPHEALDRAVARVARGAFRALDRAIATGRA